MHHPAHEWLGRYRAEGHDVLLDRSSAPATVANRTDERRVEVIAALRRLRLTGLEIAECLQMAHSTVPGILANRRRPHGALSHRPPLTRRDELNGNNPLGSYT